MNGLDSITDSMNHEVFSNSRVGDRRRERLSCCGSWDCKESNHIETAEVNCLKSILFAKPLLKTNEIKLFLNLSLKNSISASYV